MKGSLPDAIAAKDGKIIAVEVLGRQKRTPRPTPKKGKGKSRGYRYSPRSPLVSTKRFACYDDVLFVFFTYGEEGFIVELASEKYPELFKRQREEFKQQEKEIMEAIGL